MNNLPKINVAEETDRISSFIKKTFAQQHVKKTIVGVSGGLDSSTSLALLLKSFPREQIIPVHMPYFENDGEMEELSKTFKIENQIVNFSIEEVVDNICDELDISDEDLIRKGNIMARVRMVVLYDIAKQTNALVVGTENKSEHYLGYFTRFGDEASDVEPIRHLYKTQVYEIASFLGIPKAILDKKPSAGLWDGQTDENELGFSYKEADSVLYLYFDEHKNIKNIEKLGFKNARKIIDFANKNSFKRKVPYLLE